VENDRCLTCHGSLEELTKKTEILGMYRKGLICVYTGKGAGKSTAAFGLALRASGQGLKVLILQFMKLNKNIGELRALEESTLPIRIEQHGRKVFFKSRTCEPMDIHDGRSGDGNARDKTPLPKGSPGSGRYRILRKFYFLYSGKI
jgi:ATP:corrinoid adenosyltransferase